jgi:predicted transcriptional regulator
MKKSLSPECKQECDSLKAICESKKKQLDLSHMKMADELNLSQTAISHYLNGVNALNLKCSARFAKLLNV